MNVVFVMADQQRADSFGPGRHPCADHRAGDGEMHDLAADPEELVNLYADPALERRFADLMRGHLERLAAPAEQRGRLGL